eukprot:CAMPEP_0196582996 /NCGR_PEP_ID=MMETSP1081-20130531/41603_1 /TAXON_ID=36882 /ORGANISM="Pyramimonas amylifera, Strain CCMP720" /LENGTH=519 /DNA_ID=CAMNT_0041903741 /DNA_START=380 /DNA_END=1939 /DNA_ORIENTATION=-
MATRNVVPGRKFSDKEDSISAGNPPRLNRVPGGNATNFNGFQVPKDVATPRNSQRSSSLVRPATSRVPSVSRRAASAASSRPRPVLPPPTGQARRTALKSDLQLENQFSSLYVVSPPTASQVRLNAVPRVASTPSVGATGQSTQDVEQVIHVRGKSPENIEEFQKLQKLAPFDRTRVEFPRRLNMKEIDTLRAAAAKLEHAWSMDANDVEDDEDDEVDAEIAMFDSATFFPLLGTKILGHTLLATGCMPSTQVFLKKHYASVANGSVLVADVQKAGKGRGGNSWTSPPGSLLFSFTTQFTKGELLPFLQYAVALALVQTIQEEAANSFCTAYENSVSLVDVRIKWPNDVYADGKKIGGVLCESVYDMQRKEYVVVIGVGVNVSNAQPTTSVWDVIKQKDLQRSSQAGVCRPVGMTLTLPSRESILAGMLQRVESHLTALQTSGFSSLEPAYLRHWMHTSQSVTLLETDSSGRKTLEGVVICGLTKAGLLLATDSKGTRFELHPDGNSLDFFAGLVRRKL